MVVHDGWKIIGTRTVRSDDMGIFDSLVARECRRISEAGQRVLWINYQFGPYLDNVAQIIIIDAE